MPIDSKTVGSNERQVVILGDPTSSAQYTSVVAQADAVTLAGLYAAVGLQLPMLWNGTNFYRQKSASGANGIPAINTEGTKVTYSVGFGNFTPAATATDFFMIIGSGTLTVRVTRITLRGTATAASNIDIYLIKRSSANSGGTAATLTIPPHDANDAAATSVVSTYSANPTTGTSVGNVRVARLNLGAAGAAGEIVWDFTTRNSKGIVLRGVAQSLVLNWNGAAVPGGTVLTGDVEWTEE